MMSTNGTSNGAHDAGARIGAEVKATEIGAKGIGALVWMTAIDGGDVSLADLTAALSSEGSAAAPPETPSRVVRTARAAALVAKAHGYACVSRRRVADAKRGTDGWELVRGSHVDHSTSDPLGARVSPIVATARDGGFDGDTSIVSELRIAFVAAEDSLTGDDLSSWFVAKIVALGGISIKGGVYYLAPERASSFARLARAVHKASGDRYAVNHAALATAEGTIRSVVSALVTDTRAAVAEVNDAINRGVGKRALATREANCTALLTRLSRYETLLGVKLDDVRASVTEAASATAVAMLAAQADDDKDADASN